VTPRKLKTFRIVLRNELWQAFPRAGAAAIWSAMQRLEPVMLAQACELVDTEHDDDCACWHCVLMLGASISRHQAEMRVARQAADDHD